MNASNQNLSTFVVGTGDTDDSGSFEDTDGSSDKEVEESSLAAKLCKSSGIDGTKESLEKKYVNRKVDTAENHFEDRSRIANVRPMMKAER